MLVAKINPVATFAKQENPFTTTTISADSISVLARPYLLGGSEVNFEVVFGNVIPVVEAVEASEGVEAVQGQPARFEQVFSSMVNLTKDELANWGTDDTLAMEAVAVKLGAAVVSTEVL
jgi:hypothetical protein